MMPSGPGRVKPPSPNDPPGADAAPAWSASADELASWAWSRLVNRVDIWGGYNPVADREKVCTRRDGTTFVLGATCTRPPKGRRGVVALTPEVLRRHFRGERPEHVIGLHTTSPDSLSRWGTVELDCHGEGGNSPGANLRAALAWHEALTARGFRPLLWDSNGAGGYHLDVILAAPVPTPRLFWFLRELAADHARHGLPKRPETFPKQPAVNPDANGRGHYGNWVRVVGRHHTRAHWARVWDGSAWLAGADAVDFVLALAGDPAELVPADSEIRGRVNAYRRKVPNLGEGQGRDDVAYNFLAFLARDLSLGDDEALRWAGEWDAGNTPPKGPEALREILANVHLYGRREYGSGLDGCPPPPARDAGAPLRTPSAPPPEEGDGLGIILADFRERLKPCFRRGQSVFSDALGRQVNAAEGCFAPDRVLIRKLADARDAPKDGNGVVDPKRLPKFYREWARCAWQEMLTALPEEAESAEVVATAEEEFRRAVTAGLHEQVTLGREGHDPERYSLIDWAFRFARVGDWRQVRSYLIWCKREKEDGPVCVAVRVELFGQVRSAGLAGMSHRTFVALCHNYGIGEGDRAGGHRVVVLAPEFLAVVRQGACGDALTG